MSWIAKALLLTSALALLGMAPAPAWRMIGTKRIALHTRDGAVLPIGTVTFRPVGDRIAFRVAMDPARLKVFFLSMRDFRCVEGDEIQCHVPYPHDGPNTVAPGDLAWLEHALLFMTKSKGEFSAKFENGIYYPLKPTATGLVGRPQRIDLNAIAGPPVDRTVPPYADVERHDEPDGQRWIASISIQDMPATK